MFKKHSKEKPARMNRHTPERIIAALVRKMFAEKTRPIVVAVGGPGGIGKSTFAKALAAEFTDAVVLSLDDYKTARSERARRQIYGAHPDANEMELIHQHIQTLRKGSAIDKPVYCSDNGKITHFTEFAPSAFIIVEGEVATYEHFRKDIDFSIFIDSHWKTQLNTRITRDIDEKGYSPEKAIATFLQSNLREFATYGAESKNWADIHIHCDADYVLVIDAVCETLLDHI